MIQAFTKILTKVRGMADDKTTTEKKASIIVEEAQKMNYYFCSFDGADDYIYIDTHWMKISGYVLKVFLKECSCSLMDNNVAGSKRKDVDELVKQFPYTTMSLYVQPVKNKINFQNGTLDLATSTLGRHNPNEYLRYVLNYDYDPQATCPKFKEYLDRVVPDADVQNALAEYIAWLFTDTKLEKVLFLYGAGCNGKSVFIDIMEALVGKDNVCHESITDMCGENGGNHRANIVGKLLNTCSDVAPNALNGDLFKRLASGEPISTKILYQDVTSTSDYAKMLFSLNELPRTNDLTNGYFRRLMIVPFKVQIPKREINPNLAKEIIADELPGIMNWVLEGYTRLMQNQTFTQSSIIDRELDLYRNHCIGKKDRNTSGQCIILPPGFKM